MFSKNEKALPAAENHKADAGSLTNLQQIVSDLGSADAQARSHPTCSAFSFEKTPCPKVGVRWHYTPDTS